MTILCVGDSHSSLFSGYDEIQPIYPLPSKNQFRQFETIHLGPILAYSLSRPNTKHLGREKLFQLIEERSSSEYALLFCFGEIDCRYHLIRQSEIQHLPLEVIVQDCARQYFSVINEIRNRGFSTLVWNIPPPSNETFSNPEFPHHGSFERRQFATGLFNEKLKSQCASYGVPFLEVNPLYTVFNRVHPKFFFDGLHLSQYVFPYFVKALIRTTPKYGEDRELKSIERLAKPKWVVLVGLVKYYILKTWRAIKIKI